MRKKSFFVKLLMLLFILIVSGCSQNEKFSKEEAENIVRQTHESFREVEDTILTDQLYIGDSNLVGQDTKLEEYGGGYFKVLDEIFQSVQAINDYILTVCTQEVAEDYFYEIIYRENMPIYVEVDGVLYEQPVAYTTNMSAIEEIGLISWNNSEIIAQFSVENKITGYVAFYDFKVISRDEKWYVAKISEVIE